MKKLYSTMMMLAMLVAALSLTACGGDDEEEIDKLLYSSGDFIELTIDGKTYSKQYVGIYSKLRMADNMAITSSIENVFDKDGFQFFLGVAHSRDMNKLLSSSLGSYIVVDKIGFDDVPENLSLFPNYSKESHHYKVESGTHQVTSIKQNENGVQIRGTFTIIMYYKDEHVTLKGKYGITVF